MSDRTRTGLLLATLLTMTAAGCSSTPPSTTPNPATGSDSATSSAQPSTVVSLPPRPKNLSFSGIDPCKLLTAEQQAQLNINRSRQKKPAEPHNEPGCIYTVDTKPPRYDYVLIPLPKVGIQELLGKMGAVDMKVFSAAGFPAVQTQIKGGASVACFADVDVAQGQILDIQLGLTTPDGLTPDQMCADAQQAAGLAVTTLQQLNG